MRKHRQVARVVLHSVTLFDNCYFLGLTALVALKINTLGGRVYVSSTLVRLIVLYIEL